MENQTVNGSKSIDESLRKVREIERRAAGRWAAPGSTPDQDRALAVSDAASLASIKNPDVKMHAGVQMADNMKAFPEYRAAIEKGLPEHPGLAEQLKGYDAENSRRMAEKEDRKTTEVQGAAAAPATPQAPAGPGDQPAVPAAASTPEASPAPTGTLDPADLARVAANRETDSAKAREAMGLNAIEQGASRSAQSGEAQPDSSAQEAAQPEVEPKPGTASTQANPDLPNEVRSDEIFTASREDVKPVVPPDIAAKYVQVGDKYYHPQNTELVAFQDKGNRLETKSNSENIASSLVQIAQARGWDEIKVTGSETFRQEVWVEAAARGMHVKGYNPTDNDRAALAVRLGKIPDNTVEQGSEAFRGREKAAPTPQGNAPAAAAQPAAQSSNTASPATAATPAAAPAAEAEPLTLNQQRARAFAASPADAVKAHPELAGAAALAAAMDKKAEVDGLSPEQRRIVAKRVQENMVNSIERGDVPQAEIREKDQQRSNDRQAEQSR